MKFIFDNKGVLAWQRQLYRMPDASLHDEGESAVNCFVFWLNQHFALSPFELYLLNSMIAIESRRFALDVSFAISNRLPIKILGTDQRLTNKCSASVSRACVS